MKIVMVSNYINHHQIPFCNAMYDRLGQDFTFIQTMPMEEERTRMGWGVDEAAIPYVICSYEDEFRAKTLIMDCDMLLAGWTEGIQLYEDRMKAGKLTLRITERLYREGQWKFISPRGLMAKYREHIRYRNKDVYALCVGAYTASDFNLIGAYPGRRYRFGYYPATRTEAYESISSRKPTLDTVEIEMPEFLPEEPPVLTTEEIRIVWAGRFIPLKHPEYMMQLASDLVRRGFRFHIYMVGDGEMAEDLKSYLEDEMVEDYVTFYGFLAPDEVRDLMEKCHIHIFTSNFIEGWGAVVNEGMNAACAEIVNDEVGCAGYLIEDGVNGILYHDGSYEDLLAKVTGLLGEPAAIPKLGRVAYDTVVTTWNAETAADRILDFYNGWKQGHINVPADGPMSEAPVVKPGFFKTGKL